MDSATKDQKTPHVPELKDMKDLVAEILGRLPIKFLFLCRCVCKDWAGLFSNPIFLKLQMDRSPIFIFSRLQSWDGNFEFGWLAEKSNDVVESKLEFLEDLEEGGELGRLESELWLGSVLEDLDEEGGKLRRVESELGLGSVLEDLEEGGELRRVESELGLGSVLEKGGGKLHVESNKFDSGIMFSFELLHSVNSCNGLVCFYDEEYEKKYGYGGSFSLCNPILRECLTIPLPQISGFDYSRIALGFSAEKNEYKVLHCCFSCVNLCHAEIYSIGSGDWRSIEINTACMLTNQLGFNTFLGSRVHWTDGVSLVGCFNFETEEFSSFSLPPKRTSPVFNDEDGVRLGVLNDCLCSSYVEDVWGSPTVQMWIMLEYGTEDSWTLLHVIWQEPYDRSMEDFSALFSYEGEMFMCSSTEADSSYNSKEEKGRLVVKMSHCKLHSIIESIAYKPSFVSLKEVAKKEQVIVSRSTLEAENLMKLREVLSQ